MRSRQRVLFFVGISILGIGSAIAAQATTSSHTVRGRLTAANAESASVSCNQVNVSAELWINTDTRTGWMPEIKLGSTTAQGTTLAKGCDYTLTFKSYLPSLQLPVASQARLSAEKPPTPDGEAGIGYAHKMSQPFPEEYDMKL